MVTNSPSIQFGARRLDGAVVITTQNTVLLLCTLTWIRYFYKAGYNTGPSLTSDENKIARQREAKKRYMQRYRNKLKKNPVAVEEARRKDRERYLKKKERGAVKLIKNCTPQEQKQMREKWKQRAKRYRTRKSVHEKVKAKKTRGDIDMLQESLPGLFGGRNEFKYINRRGGTVLLHEGYQFIKKSTYKNGAKVWECYLRKKNKCTGTMTIKENRIIKQTTHTCTPDFNKNLLECYIDNCKKKIVSSEVPFVPTVYNDTVSALKDLGLDKVIKIPTFESKKSTLYRYRNKTFSVDKNNVLKM